MQLSTVDMAAAMPGTPDAPSSTQCAHLAGGAHSPSAVPSRVLAALEASPWRPSSAVLDAQPWVTLDGWRPALAPDPGHTPKCPHLNAVCNALEALAWRGWVPTTLGGTAILQPDVSCTPPAAVSDAHTAQQEASCTLQDAPAAWRMCSAALLQWRDHTVRSNGKEDYALVARCVMGHAADVGAAYCTPGEAAGVPRGSTAWVLCSVPGVRPAGAALQGLLLHCAEQGVHTVVLLTCTAHTPVQLRNKVAAAKGKALAAVPQGKSLPHFTMWSTHALQVPAWRHCTVPTHVPLTPEHAKLVHAALDARGAEEGVQAAASLPRIRELSDPMVAALGLTRGVTVALLVPGGASGAHGAVEYREVF